MKSIYENNITGFNDQPLKAEGEDLFEIQPYIDGLSSFIKSCVTPMTISIQGDWGSGKTSIMKLVQKNLEKTEGQIIKCIEFNTWQFSLLNDEDDLNYILIKKLIDSLEELSGSSNIIDNKTISRFFQALTFFATKNALGIDTAKEVSGFVSQSIQGMTDAVDAINDFKSNFEKAVSAALAIQKQLISQGTSIDEICQSESKTGFIKFVKDSLGISKNNKKKLKNYDSDQIVDSNREEENELSAYDIENTSSLELDPSSRLVIFIDDLDRLQPSRAVDVLEVLKTFLDSQHCVFVLAIDYDVVSKGVMQKYGDLILEDKGKSFFDKIIQVPFKVPVERYSLYSFVKGCFEALDIMEKENLDSYMSLINSSIGQNPRSMKRLFNSYILLYKIREAEKAAQKQDNKTKNVESEDEHLMLFALLCCQQSFPELYSYMARKPYLFEESSAWSYMQDINNYLIGYEEEEEQDTEDEKIQEFRSLEKQDLLRMINFIKTVSEVLSKQDDDLPNQEVLRKFVELLGYTSVTSTGDEETSQVGSAERKRRDYIKSLAKASRELIQYDQVENTNNTYLYRLQVSQNQNDKNNIKLHEADIISHFRTDMGFNLLLHCVLSNELTSNDLSLKFFLEFSPKSKRDEYNKFRQSISDDWNPNGKNDFERIFFSDGNWDDQKLSLSELNDYENNMDIVNAISRELTASISRVEKALKNYQE